MKNLFFASPRYLFIVQPFKYHYFLAAQPFQLNSTLPRACKQTKNHSAAKLYPEFVVLPPPPRAFVTTGDSQQLVTPFVLIQ